jgi:hypothetical protein
MAFDLRPLVHAELVELLRAVGSEYVFGLLDEEIRVFPFHTHFLLAKTLETLIFSKILTLDSFYHFRCLIMDTFLDFGTKMSMSPGRIPDEPFVTVFCAVASLLEPFDKGMFEDLLDFLDEDQPEFRNEYEQFVQIRNDSHDVLSVLKRDDPAAFAAVPDQEIAQEVLQLFGLATANVRPVAAALCGATRCLGAQRPSDPAFEIAVVWGNCNLLAKDLDADTLTRHAITYHRYDFHLVSEEWAAQLAIDCDNVVALRNLASGGVAMTAELLEQAATLPRTCVLTFLLETEAPTSATLEMALRSGNPACVRAMLQARSIDVNAPMDEGGWTALHFACHLRLANVVKVLLDTPGIDINIQDQEGLTAMDIASDGGAEDIVALFERL